jgi:lipopolysaccharide/colanic/teichoic acid biosynthesis glycosyltransferase
VVGFVDDFLPAGTEVTDGLKVLGPPSALSRIVHDTGVTEIIVVPTAMAWESFQDLLRAGTNLNGHTIRMSPDFREVLATSMKVHQFGFMPLLTIERVRITGLDAVLKRIMDYGAALSLLPVAVPLVTLLSGMLLATGVRPIRRVQTIGRKGRTFSAFWLNTAQPRNDLQQLIFQLRLDKLPQLLNVVLGQMSIVGPRPVPVDEKREVEQWLPNLVTVNPGITGPWAVGGAGHSIEGEMRSTLFYIRNYTIWLDLDILVRSIFRVLTGVERRGGKKEAIGHDRAAVYH